MDTPPALLRTRSLVIEPWSFSSPCSLPPCTSPASHSHSALRTLLALAALTFTARAQAADTPTASTPSVSTATAPAPRTAPKKQFLIILRLAPRLHDDTAWTDADKATVSAHFQRLKAATDAGQVILAGRTPEAGDKTMGLVVFTADDEAAARAFMLGDPCIAAGVMFGELRPFSLAHLRK